MQSKPEKRNVCIIATYNRSKCEGFALNCNLIRPSQETNQGCTYVMRFVRKIFILFFWKTDIAQFERRLKINKKKRSKLKGCMYLIEICTLISGNINIFFYIISTERNIRITNPFMSRSLNTFNSDNCIDDIEKCRS